MLPMPLFQIPSTVASVSSPFRLQSVFTLALALVLGLATCPPASQAQLESANINFCTLFQESPRTEDARSAVNDEWNANDGSWESIGRVIQTFNGDTLTELTIQERTESGTWRDTARATPEYDSSDRLDLCTVQTKQGGNFVNTLRNDLRYNSDGRLDTLLTQTWDSTDANPDGEWVNVLRSTFEYDGSGNDTLEVVEAFIPGVGWTNSQRFHRMYDSQDRIELERQENWAPPLGPWENVRRTQFTYASDSTVAVNETWENSSWVNDARTTTMLNNSDLPTGTLTEDWDGSGWVNDERSTNTYTTDESTQKFERIVVEDWDAGAGEWVNDNRTRFSYDTIIPVELARFDAQRTGEGAVRLTWQTASETNNSGFAVQRRVSDASAPGARQAGSEATASWNAVQFVEGAGTTSEPQSYQFTDRSVPYEAETVRYRLRQVDLDGSAQLSKTVEVRLGVPERLALHAPFPNPSRNETTVRYELPAATEVQIAVYDVLGRRVATPVDGREDAGPVQFQLRTQHLPSGTYILRLQAAEQTRTQRLTVVK